MQLGDGDGGGERAEDGSKRGRGGMINEFLTQTSIKVKGHISILFCQQIT
jgi:hypothetical protein